MINLNLDRLSEGGKRGGGDCPPRLFHLQTFNFTLIVTLTNRVHCSYIASLSGVFDSAWNLFSEVFDFAHAASRVS